MARKSTAHNGNGRLEEAMATLLQTQTAFLSRLAESDRVSAERFARIERDMIAILRVLDEHGRVLAHHGRILEQLLPELLAKLPDAVREKFGFQAPKPA